MRKRFMQLAAAVLVLCMAVPPASAVVRDRNGQIMIRVGLASSSSHVPTGELESANLENNNSQGFGWGYRFGYYDGNLNFVELARTDRDTIAVSVLKTQNLRYDGSRYTSEGGGVSVGCYHIRVPGSWGSSGEAAAVAAGYDGGFVAWIDNAYQVRVGAYPSKEAAEAANSFGGTVVGTSSYGMSVVKTGSDRILFQYDCGPSGKLAIQPDVTGAGETRTWFDGYKYRGGFQYHRQTGGNLTVVNIVTLEDYVNGVACYEMGREWPLEALKAQALCARTYVLKNLNKHDSYGFDICTTASCQVYHGMGTQRVDFGPTEVSMRAVAETSGQVITYNGRLAEVFYSSSFGGASEDAKNVWGTDTVSEYPYLRGVEDPYEADLDDRNSMSPWTVSYTAAQLTQQLQKYGLGVGTTVKSLDLTYSKLGNVIQAVVRWSNGQSSTISASNIRSRFDVRSIRFTVNGAGTGDGTAVTPPAAGGGASMSINGSGTASGLEGKYAISGSGALSQIGGDSYIISGTGSVSALEGQGHSGNTAAPVQPGSGTVSVSGSTYTFSGGGWGHQVGMSQYGANAMARRGFTGEDIIQFYFPGVQITRY